MLAHICLGPAAAVAREAQASPIGLPSQVLAAPPDPAGDRPDWLGRAVALFDRGALSNERNGDRPLTKWTTEIDIAVRGDAAALWLPRVEEIAAELAELTGRAITVHDNPLWAGDIDVHVTNHASYWPFLVDPADGRRDQPFTCVALPSALNGEMRGSRIHINAGVLPPRTVRACLMEEIFQSMGFFGESSDEPSSLLDDDVGYQELGSLDRLLLRTLYDPRLSAGMERTQALTVARRIMAEQLSR
jgi:hypothetical protein